MSKESNMLTNQGLQGKLQTEITELSHSINSIVESFRKLQTPLVESRQKVPQATNQLDKISEQTEAAAHRMLDTIEQITQRESEVIEGLDTIRDLASGGAPAEIMPIVQAIQEKAKTNLNDAYTIMDALQFQDITSQQMDHAASLLEEIEAKLQHILVTVGADPSQTPSEKGKKPKKQRAYDPHADLFDKKTDQADIDSLFERTKSK